jgi:outer membrane protein assembly factor BamE (lipoprotein component of BamABCDE complex)
MTMDKRDRPTKLHRPEMGGRSEQRSVAIVAALLLASTLAACSPTIHRHGHHLEAAELQQVQPGMGQDQVKAVLGSPTTTATVSGGQAYYYISSTTSQSSLFAPNETDRQVVAVYFNPTGSVDRVANYGMKDGKVFDFVSRTTPHHAKDEGLLRSLFRNLGVKQLGL